MPKRKNVNKQQRKAIRTYVKQGLSANKIQKRLQKRHLGLRRKVLLAEIRKVKHRKPKADIVKYIPKKYAKARWRARAEAPRKRRLRLGYKQVILTGRHKGKMVTKTRHGKGRDLYRFVFNEMRSDFWDAKPHVES